MYSLPQSYNQTSKCKRCISSNAYKEKETAYYFYIAEGIGHSLSYSPMKDNRRDILSFLNRLVLGKEKRCITTVEKNPEISRYKSDFTIEDYIRENMR